MTTTKSQIFFYVSDLTKEAVETMNFTDLFTDALNISLDLKMERSNVSRILNQLHREGSLIKVQGRPTIFVSRRILEDLATDIYIPSVIPTGKTINDYIITTVKQKQGTVSNSFDSYTYNERSRMNVPINQAMSAILYPPHGVNTLIIGEPSAGKGDFASTMYEYAKAMKTIQQSRKLVSLDCLNYTHTQENTMTLQKALFGFYSRGEYHKGAIEEARGSILVIRNLERIDTFTLTMLRQATIDINYLPINSPANSKPEKVNCLIIGITEAETLSNSPDVKRIFPIQIKLPALRERTIEEMVILTLQYFQKEAEQINTTIRVNKGVLSCFVMSEYSGNLAHLKSEIKQSCASSYRKSLSTDSFFIDVDLEDISSPVLECIHDINDRIDDLNDLLILFENEHLFFSPVQNNKELELLIDINRDLTRPSFDEINRLNNQLVDTCIHDINHVTSIQLNTIRAVLLKDIYQALYPVLSQSSLKDNENLLYGLLLHLSSVIKQLKQGIYSLQIDATNYKIANAKDYKTAELLKQSIENVYKLELPEYEIDYIATYLYLSSQWIENKYIQLLILSDNNDNARNYATYLNSLNHKATAYSLDIHKEVPIATTLDNIALTLKKINRGKGVVIATDSALIFDSINDLKSITTVDFTCVHDISVQTLASIMQRIDSLDITLSAIEYAPLNEIVRSSIDDEHSHSYALIKEISEKLLSESLVFLNPDKACNVLFTVLQRILTELKINYSDELLVKFIFHSCFLIERCIRKDPMNDPQAKTTISNNPRIHYVIEKNFSVVNETFSINVPPTELGMVIEIFVPHYQLKNDEMERS